ncbi:MAG: hypothetical protein ABJE66_38440 [Deltaproteobacteria bacterium]
MGNQQTAQSATTTQAPSNAQAAKPKSSSFDPAHPTGIPAADTAELGTCKGNTSRPGCVMDADQRRAFVDLFNVRVLEVRSNCQGALQLIKVQELIKKPDELPWYAGVLLDVVAAVLTDGLSLLVSAGVRGVAGALGRGAMAAAETVAAEIDVQKMRALISIAAPPPQMPATISGIKKVIGATVNAAKGAAKPHVADALSDSGVTEQQTAATGYINYLEGALDQKFDDLMRTAPGVTNDTELQALYDSLNPKEPCGNNLTTRREWWMAMDLGRGRVIYGGGDDRRRGSRQVRSALAVDGRADASVLGGDRGRLAG